MNPTLKRTATIAAAMLGTALLLPGAASGQNGKGQAERLAAKQCQQERNADRAAFQATYGKNAMRNCRRAARSEARAELRNAAQECRAEREELGADAFREQYGTNAGRGQGQGRNAFGKCVSQKTRAAMRENAETFRNAARECRAEREEAGVEAFREQYGSEKSRGRNAFGKCVSSKVRDAGDEEPTTEE